MKKTLILGLFAMFALASCKKDYTCECTSTVDGPNGSATTTSSTTINDTKKNAEATCDEGDDSTTSGGYTSTVECTLK